MHGSVPDMGRFDRMDRNTGSGDRLLALLAEISGLPAART
jgi:hypothetical protein